MRWLPVLLSAFALPLGSFAAKSSSSADRFQTFHTQAVSSSPLKLTDASYKKLTTAPRDYSVAVLLTALDAKYGCLLCGIFQTEWDILGKSWIKGDKKGESRLILSTLDFSDGRETFMSVSTPLKTYQLVTRLIIGTFLSSVCKQPRYSCSFSLQSDPMRFLVLSLFDMTLQAGMPK
jgi:oligosaccharyltransferase complex subunit gamma